MRREVAWVDPPFDVDEFVDVELLALASPSALTFALGDVFVRPPVVDSAPFAVDSPRDAAPFALDAAVPAAPLARFVRLDVSVLPLAEPLVLTGPAFAPAELEAEPDPFAKPVT